MKFNDKISNLLQSQLPEFVVEDHPKFVSFLKTYYAFLESCELGVREVQTTDGILLETETNQENLLLLDGGRLGSTRTQLDSGDKVLQETSIYGKFTNGEIVEGETSKAQATIVAEDLGNARLFVTAQSKFVKGEIIRGKSSNASAVINTYRENPVKNISDLVSYRDPDNAISSFLTHFREEFLNTLPENLATGVDKRNLIKNIKSLYRLKGTAEGNKIFFRLLFNEISETIYPRESLLRVSDGNFDSKIILRAINDNETDTIKLIGRTITGQTSGATAIIENVFKYAFGQYQISEFILNNATTEGTFTIGEQVTGTETDDTDTFIKATITGIPGNKTITNDGSLYDVGDVISLTGGGIGAKFVADTVAGGPVDELIIDDGGFDFEIGDKLNFDNEGTEGGGAQAFVSVVNGGIRVDEGMADGNTIFPENTTSTNGQKYLSGPILSYDERTFSTGYGNADLLGTLNSGTAVPLITGVSSGATATVRYNNKGTSDADYEFNDNVLYITYTSLNATFEKGEFIRINPPAVTENITVSVVNNGSQNVYQIDGVQQKTLDLKEGNTYIFSHSGAHPFRFSTDSANTQPYTTGVTVVNSSTVQIVVPTGAPTLYYYCANHSNMGGIANTPENSFTVRLRPGFGREAFTGPEAEIADRDSSMQMVRNLSLSTDQEDHIVLEDETVRGDSYAGDKIVQERNTGVGDITDIFIINNGNGYKKLPTISFAGSSGQDEQIKAFGSEIGRIVKLKTTEHGIRYEQPPSPPQLKFITNGIVTNVLGTFVSEEQISGTTSGFTADVITFDAVRGLIKLENVSGTPTLGERITGGLSGAQATFLKSDVASATVDVVSSIETDGLYINEDGHVSENTMKIQDSLLYQDFSYIIKVGESINTWRDSFKKTMHASGFYFTGQVAIENRISGGIKSPIEGIQTGIQEGPFFNILSTIFATLVGRRMGTETDGTTLRSSPQSSVSAVASVPGQVEHFPTNTRDTTVKLQYKVSAVVTRIRRNVGLYNVTQGFAYAGPRWETLNKLHHSSFVTGSNASNINFSTLGNIKITGTRTPLDGTGALFTTVSTPEGKMLKCNFAIPAQISFSSQDFATTLLSFDTTSTTFDDNTP